MPDDSNGIYSVPAGTIVTTGDTILPSQHNPWANDSASAISNRFSKDGRAPATGNWNINSFRLTNVGSPVADGDAVNKSYAEANFVSSTTPIGEFKNKLINPLGIVNQRVYVSGAATSSANQYTLDRWRVVVSGQALTWTESSGVRTMTAPAGGVEQVIEGSCIISGSYSLSWEGTATATVNGTTRAKNEIFTLVGGTNCTVRFTGGTFALPQLEAGVVTSFSPRHFFQELELCSWYCQKSYEYNVSIGTNTVIGAWTSVSLNVADFYDYGRVEFQGRMRRVPDVTTYSYLGTPNVLGNLSLGANQGSAAVTNVSQRGFRLFCSNNQMTANNAFAQHFIADGEIY